MRSEVGSGTVAEAAVGAEALSPEKLEEEKLMKKYPGAMKKGPNALVQKRLFQGRKFFDSGDYNMAKAKGQLKPNPMARPEPPQPSLSVVVDAGEGASSESAVPKENPITGNAIPTPDTVPLRKSSIIHPSSDKLSPQPLVHHEPELNEAES